MLRGVAHTMGRRRVFGTLAGLGTLAGIEDPNAVLIGTQLRFQGAIEDSLTGIDVFTVSNGNLDGIGNGMINRGYRILRRTSSGSEITVDVEVRTEKASVEAAIVDFERAVRDEMQSNLVLYNVRYDALFNPRDNTGNRVTNTTNDPDGNGGSIWDKLGLGDFANQSFSFLGGTLTGATLAIGAAIVFLVWKR